MPQASEFSDFLVFLYPWTKAIGSGRIMNTGGATDRMDGIDYRAIFQQSPDPLLVLAVEADGVVFRSVEANLAAERLSGIPREILLGATLEDIFPPDQVSVLGNHYRHCLAKGDVVEFEQALETPVGCLMWQVRAAPFCSPGRFSHLI